MNITLDYGRTGLDIRLPDSLNIDVVEPRYRQALPDQPAAVEDALLRPISSKPLRDLVKQSGTVGVVFNDITRPTPYKIILPVLIRALGSIPDERILFFNATGTHRAAYLRWFFGWRQGCHARAGFAGDRAWKP